MTGNDKMSAMDLKACIDACSTCHEVCTETAQYCLEKGGKHATAGHIMLLLNCAEIAAACVSFMAGKSPFHVQLCGLCAEICEKCATECEGLGDEIMKKCAAVCRKCAEFCKNHAKHGCC